MSLRGCEREPAHARPVANDGAAVVAPASFEQCEQRGFRRDWQRLVEGSDNLYVQYQSPEWFSHLRDTAEPGVLPPIAVYDPAWRLIGLAPLIAADHDLGVTVRERVIWRARLRTVQVLGSQPLLPDDPALHDRVFETIAASAPETDAIYLHSVPLDSPLWRHLATSTRLAERFHVYVPGGERIFHLLAPPPTFDAYLRKFTAKKRYNLRRQARLLAEHGGGPLHLRRFERPEEVGAFITAARELVRHSRREDRRASYLEDRGGGHSSIADAAQRGLLRAYILESGGAPRAFVLGYQYRSVFHYAEIGYDQRVARCSPGAVLLYLLIEDVIQHRPPKWVSFGIGDDAYKREFGTVRRADASVLLLRRTVANLARMRAHQALTALHGAAKRALGRA
jgi:hypothetical protein